MIQEPTRKIAESVMLLVVARVSMALALPVLGLVAMLGQQWIDARFETQEASIKRVEQSAGNATAQALEVKDRLTVVETKQATDAATAATFQKDTLTRLDRLQDSIVSMSNAIAALTATMQAREDYDRRQQLQR